MVSESKANDLVKEIEKSGGKAVAVKGDVSKLADVQHLFNEAIKHFGGVDILINNVSFEKNQYSESRLELYQAP